MKIPSPNQVSNEIKSLTRKMNYYSNRAEKEFITKDDYLDKIRHLTRERDILDVIQAIYNAKEILSSLAHIYFNLYKLGCPEQFLINNLKYKKSNEETESKDFEYEQILLDVKVQIVHCTRLLNSSMKRIKLEDTIQETINFISLDDDD